MLLFNPSQSVDIILNIWEPFLKNITNAYIFSKFVWKKVGLSKHSTCKEEY